MGKYRIIALFDATMILLESIVEIRVGPVEDIIPKYLPDGTRVGIMSIGCHALRGVSNDNNASLRMRMFTLTASIS